MKRVRFFIDLGLGRTHAEHFDFQDTDSVDTIQLQFEQWLKKLNQGWEELEEVPSIYKEVNNDPGTDSVLLQYDSTEQSIPLGQQSEEHSELAELHEMPRGSET